MFQASSISMPNHNGGLHSLLLYGAYAWLLLSGSLHFLVDVLSQYLRGKRTPKPATTLYYGLNSSHALSQILFATLALFALRHGLPALNRGFGLVLSFLAAAAGWCWPSCSWNIGSPA